MKISVIGTGYVGLIQAVGLANFGFKVIGIDIDDSKVKMLNNGICPLYEEGLEELLKKHTGKNLEFTTSYEKIKDSEVIFLCVGTPQDNNGNTDLKYIFSAVDNLKKHISGKKYLVVKSTVPIGTNQLLKERLNGYNIEIISNPEFLREGMALKDFLNPERIILGFDENDLSSKEILKYIYQYFIEKNIPLILTNYETAEMIKYASNAFLATKISFINELSKLADKTNADIKTVSYAMGLDDRIGKKFLNAGIGYGGSCFPKDVKSLTKQFESKGIDPKLMTATDSVNENQVKWFFEKIKNYYGDISGKTFAVLGLAFKPDTDDLRESASIKLIDLLLKEDAIIKGFDNVKRARENAYNMYTLDKSKAFYGYNLYILDSLVEAVTGVDGIIFAVEDTKFNTIDFENIFNMVNEKVIFDGRNIIDNEKIKKIEFEYIGVGLR
ncbi:UDP-glucose 6-dehydrogenase [Methanococcus vannielii SB]|uniref:UDP-glucose 6-dehydrogenase n=1 Tax=Methanococcus vannielii (strain ATCC 35089 / DSM 1224 / JCM 13029 / OCM 148 / SB) TaxID=406327 RepID=A6UP99_METVS|nr:UDP-glucose/GDP-mannose dehydrogenase family protein [Methanococcus vannielii]ABR54321.1 UDP-glucose 6-dehydrogenase [Methanococcus vannielii SB]